jgi:uncharacterized protein HemY
LGRVALGRNDFSLAHKHFQQSLDVAYSGDNTMDEAYVLRHIAELQQQQGEYEQAQKTLNRAIFLYQKLGMKGSADKAYKLQQEIEWQLKANKAG